MKLSFCTPLMQAAMILLMTENAAAGSCYAHDLLLHLFSIMKSGRIQS